MGILCWFFVFVFRGQSVFFWVVLWFVLFLVPFWVVGLSSFGLWGGYFLFAFFVLFCFFFCFFCFFFFFFLCGVVVWFFWGLFFFKGYGLCGVSQPIGFIVFGVFGLGLGLEKKKKKKKS